jgi:flavin reductase (DIM6/NTAB) family NADH-FMN oxidoreductase RutF
VHEQYAGGDHTLFLADVLDGEVLSDARPPLLFYRARYRRLVERKD